MDIEDQEHDNIPTENAKNQQDVMHELISDTNSRIIYARKRVSSGQQIEADEMRATTKRASSGQQIEADEMRATTKRASSGQQIEADEMRATTKRASSGQQIEADERGLLLKEPHQASKLRQTK